jgi:hypothetical protein
VPYLTQRLQRQEPRPPYRGLGASATDPRHGTPAEWEAYYSRKSWERKRVRFGPRTGEWQKQADWSAEALQRLIAGESVTVKPAPTDPELLALIVNGRAWLLTLPEWQLYDAFPGLTPKILAYARRVLIPGHDVIAIAEAKLQADIERLKTDSARLAKLRAETMRYANFANDTMKQFQTYITWFEHHMKKKEKRTQVVAGVMTAVSTVLYFIPVVGWALGLILDSVNVAWQLDRMKDAIEAMQAAGARVEGARVYVALMESLAVVITHLDNAEGVVNWQLHLQEKQLEILKTVSRPAVEGAPQPAGVAPPSGIAPSTAASDASIVRALMGEASRAFKGAVAAPGKLVAAAMVGAAALLAIFGRRRRG